MTRDRLPPAAGDPLRQAGRRLAVAFEAFHETHYRKWLAYAHLHTGSEEAALEVTGAAYRRLRLCWPYALKQSSVDSYAWAVLKETVVDWLGANGRGTALTQSAAFAVVTRALLRECQQQFALLESQLGLYEAISRLPERQCDVIVLRHVVGYSDAQIAALLGVDEATVRSHASRGKRRLAAALGIAACPTKGN